MGNEEFSDRKGRSLATTVPGPDASPFPGAHTQGLEDPGQIGPYRILRRLGEGGMGVVYLAEQTEPVKRRVALKMLRGGLNQRELQVRFEAERQAMARLSQPNVARLYDAGSTDAGIPYFVMELVDGVPITEYCDRNRLGIRARIELFQAVCDGVQHAHEKSVLHRDLKPSNILVTEENGRGVPKVLDFGIAKAVDQPLVDGTLITGEQVIGTPAYLSPEAVSTAGSDMDVDTRSDVYSLGVSLYELLVGVRPFATEGLPFVQVLQRITEEEPTEPSVMWSHLDEMRQSRAAEARSLDAASIATRLRGDLDWIVLKAIAKDRRERYASAAALAADLDRYLRDQPVEAGPPSLSYRVGKFVRRRRGLVATASLLLLSLLMGLTGTLVNLERAKRQAERANEQTAATQLALEETEEISEFLKSLFEVSDPGAARGNTVTARELLDRGAEKFRTEFENRPLTRARFMVTIGEVYERLGLYEQAEPLLEDALATRERELGERHLDVASVADTLGQLRFQQGRLEESSVLFERALEIREEQLEPDHPDVGSSLNHLAYLMMSQGQYEAAEPLHRRGLEILEKALGPDHPELVRGLTALGALYHAQTRYSESELVLRRALAIREATLEPDHPDLASSLFNLANALTSQGFYEEAEDLFLRCLAIQEETLGPQHPTYAQGLGNLAWLYQEQGRYRDAEAPYRRALEIFERALGPDHPNNSLILDGLGVIASEQGRYEEARASLERSIELKEGAFGSEHPEVATTVSYLAESYRVRGRLGEAEDLHRRALSIREKTLGDRHATVAGSLEKLAIVLMERDRYADAEPLYERALAIHEEQSPVNEESLNESRLGYSKLLRAAGREAEATALEALVSTAP